MVPAACEDVVSAYPFQQMLEIRRHGDDSVPPLLFLRPDSEMKLMSSEKSPRQLTDLGVDEASNRR